MSERQKECIHAQSVVEGHVMSPSPHSHAASRGTDQAQPTSVVRTRAVARFMDEISTVEFDCDDFDARNFVQRWRKRLPLSELQKSLRQHHGEKKKELVELINDKYADFVSLSSRMQGVERALRPLHAPLEESSQITQSLKNRLGGLLEQAGETRKSVAQLRARRSALTLYIENAKLLQKAKEVTEQRWVHHDGDMREHVAQENVARDLRRIRLNLTRTSLAKDSGTETEQVLSPECQALVAEASALEVSFVERLREQLQGFALEAKASWETDTAQSGESSKSVAAHRRVLMAMAHLSRALTTLGRGDVAEAVFEEVFVKRVLDSGAAACSSAAETKRLAATDAAAVAPGAGAVDLGPFFDYVGTALFGDASPLLWIARCLRGESGSGEASVESALLDVPALRLVSNSMALPVLQYVLRVWTYVFMPAFPDVFAANYGRSARFITHAQSLMGNAERRAFAGSDVLADFNRRWKTQVYSSLRSKEAMKRLEAAGGGSQVTGQQLVTVSAELVTILRLVWSDRWYLAVLYSKMVQLSLELLATYCNIVLKATRPQDEAAISTTAAWDASSTPPCWAATSSPAQLPHVATEVLSILAQLECGETPDLSQGVIARLMLDRAVGDRAAALTRDLIIEGCAAVQPSLEAIEAAMRRQVLAVVVPHFGAIRSIPAFYRMLNKPVPTRAYPYVELVTRPIVAFSEALGAAPTVALEWTQRVVNSAAQEFSVQAANLLESTKQQEATLQRLSGKATGGDEVSDLDKIHMQLCLDVETFTKAMTNLGLEVARAPGLVKLSQAVAPVWQVFEAHRPK